jgi:ATP-dependent DNA ligase
VVDRIRNQQTETYTEKLRYLIFDTLVHLGRDVRKEDFVQRLECAELFLRNNKFSLAWKGGSVGLDQ